MAASPALSSGVRLDRTPTPRSRFEAFIKVLLIGASLLSVVTTLCIVGSLVFETIAFFGDIPVFDFLFGTKWSPTFAGEQASFGVLPLLWGTLYLSLMALLVAIPLGLLCAIYLSEFAKPRVRKTIKPVLEILAGVPTIVFGYFALTFFTPTILQGLGINVGVYNGLSAAIIMGLLVLPTIASIAEDSMSAVPLSLREGAFGLGANRMQVSLRVVFPAALSGIVAALVLGASRAIGETMIVAIAAGQQPRLTGNPFVPIETMTAYIVQVSLGDTPQGTIEYKTIFAVGMLLFLMTFGLNLVSTWLRERFREEYA